MSVTGRQWVTSVSPSSVCADLLGIVFPHLDAVLVERVWVESGTVRVAARTRDGVGLARPDCGEVSARVHSRYGRVVADLAVGSRPVEIELTVRRFFCDRPDCGRRTFAEQVEDLTVRTGRRRVRAQARPPVCDAPSRPGGPASGGRHRPGGGGVPGDDGRAQYGEDAGTAASWGRPPYEPGVAAKRPYTHDVFSLLQGTCRRGPRTCGADPPASPPRTPRSPWSPHTRGPGPQIELGVALLRGLLNGQSDSMGSNVSSGAAIEECAPFREPGDQGVGSAVRGGPLLPVVPCRDRGRGAPGRHGAPSTRCTRP
nr:transposase family protein [Streptomyces sp. CB02923]